MNCEHVRPLLPLLVYGEVDEAETAAPDDQTGQPADPESATWVGPGDSEVEWD